MKVFINWETDGKNIELPDEVEIPKHIGTEDVDITDYLSNKYGWLVKSFTIIK